MWSPYGIALKLLWGCFGVALELLWSLMRSCGGFGAGEVACSGGGFGAVGALPEMTPSVECGGWFHRTNPNASERMAAALKLLPNCPEIAPKLLRNCSEIAPKLLLICLEMALKLFKNCSGTALKLL